MQQPATANRDPFNAHRNGNTTVVYYSAPLEWGSQMQNHSADQSCQLATRLLKQFQQRVNIYIMYSDNKLCHKKRVNDHTTPTELHDRPQTADHFVSACVNAAKIFSLTSS